MRSVLTLPWFLNPWAEVRRLRDEIRRREMNYKGLTVAWREERRDGFRLAKENGELKRRIAGMEEQVGIDQRRTDYIRRTAG